MCIVCKEAYSLWLISIHIFTRNDMERTLNISFSYNVAISLHKCIDSAPDSPERDLVTVISLHQHLIVVFPQHPPSADV